MAGRTRPRAHMDSADEGGGRFRYDDAPARAYGFGQESMHLPSIFRKLTAPLAAVAFALALACGTDGGDTAERPSSAVQTERAEIVAPTGEIGFDLGDRIPEFEISLTSGESLSSAQLQASERPTFLFFFSMT